MAPQWHHDRLHSISNSESMKKLHTFKLLRPCSREIPDCLNGVNTRADVAALTSPTPIRQHDRQDPLGKNSHSVSQKITEMEMVWLTSKPTDAVNGFWTPPASPSLFLGFKGGWHPA